MNRKWYLQTWFIALLFALWFFIVPAIIGIILLIIQFKDDQKVASLVKELHQFDEKIKQKEEEIKNLDNLFKERERRLEEALEAKRIDFDKKKIKIKMETEQEISMVMKSCEEQKALLKKELDRLTNELNLIVSDILVEHYRAADYECLLSEDCKTELAVIKTTIQRLIKDSKAVNVFSNRTKRECADNVKQIIRCFGSECANLFLEVGVKNIDSVRSKVVKSFEMLNKIFKVDGIELTNEFLELKLKELNFIYSYEVKKEQERELQRSVKEQMLEEEKVRREIERQKAKIEKDQQQCSNEIKRLMVYLQKSDGDAEKQLYIDKISELESKIKELETEKDDVLKKEANARAGYVYIISNIGSFGEDVFKIGMTRRLEPMERIRELGDASVPFEFDVHALIFSDDAPALENLLHKQFENQSVNRVNVRKEFFRVSLDEIERHVKENFNNTVRFTKIPAAKEYRKTIEIISNELGKRILDDANQSGDKMLVC